ncbi:MAG: hypothetical protein NTV54_06635 [Ignavibacteriales bacterium]|nr:hypothetical protein [Ignavibacteriales bacterium]
MKENTNIQRSTQHEKPATVTTEIGTAMQNSNTHATNKLVGDTKMERNNLFSKIGATVILVSLMMVASVTNAFAIGTPAGTTITTKAKVSYKASTNSDDRSKESDPVTLMVAYKVVIEASANQTPPATLDGVTVTLPLTLINNGNADDSFSLTVGGTHPTIAGVGATYGWEVTFVEHGTSNAVTSPVSILSGASLQLDAKIRVPNDPYNTITKDANSYTVTVVAASLKNAAGVTYAIVNEHAASDPFIATIAIAKPVIKYTVTSNPVNPTSVLPGDVVTYTLLVQNTGSVAASSVNVNWTYTQGNFSSTTAAPGGSAGTGTASWTGLSLGAGGSTPLTFTGTVSPTLPAGTYYVGTTSGSQISYSDGTNSHTWTSSGASYGPFSFTIINVRGFLVTLETPANYTAEPGTVKTYTINVKNVGNSSDNFTISSIAGTGDVLGSIATFPTGGYSSIAPGQTQPVPFEVAIPISAVYMDLSVRNITVVGLNSGTFATGTQLTLDGLTTTVIAAKLSISLTPSNLTHSGNVTNPEPGDQIQYEVIVRNDGSIPTPDTVFCENTSAFPNTVIIGNVYVSTNGTSYLPTAYADGESFGLNGKVYIWGRNVGVRFEPLVASATVKYKYIVTLNKP